MFKKYEELFEALLENSKITTKELKELGYYAKKINEVIDLGIIKREKRGQYSVVSEEILSEYKKYLEANSYDYEKIRKEFLKVLETDSEEDILTVFRKLQEAATAEQDRRDVNFYLILLSNIFVLSNEEIETIKMFKFQDYITLIEDERFILRNSENKMRKNVYGNKIYKAMSEFKLSNNKDEISKQIENILLNKVLLYVDKVRDFEGELVDREKYDELLEFLTSRMRRRIMSPPEHALLLIIKKYNKVLKSGMALSIKEDETENYIKQIICNNFSKAYNLFFEKYGKSSNTERGDFIEKALRRTVELANQLEMVNSSSDDKVVNNTMNEETTNSKSYQESDTQIEVNNELVEEKNSYEENVFDNYSYENPLDKLINEKIDELYEGKSIIVLDPMSDEDRKYIHEMISTYYDVVSFSIDEGCERRVVLRFKPAFDAKEKGRIKQEDRGNYCHYPEVIAALKAKIRNKDYSGALIECRKLIEAGTPREETFLTMARCLLRLGKRQEAIDCFRVVTNLSSKHDYSYFIDNLSGIDTEDKKPNFQMDINEFTDSEEVDFNNLDTLVALIAEEGKSLEEAIAEMGLDPDSADIARLIYARDCYYQEKYKEGDKYLLRVEGRKKKSAYVIKLAEEIRISRRFYKNRLDSNNNCLVLKRG